MLFSEIYGSYFSAVARILERAVEGTLDGKALYAVVRETAFGESLLTIPAAIAEERWPLLDRDYGTPIRHSPTMPLTTLQKQWMKALLQDPRIRLFSPSEEGLEDVEPLYDLDSFVYFDRYTDGDPYEDGAYIAHFRAILQAMKERRKIRVRYLGSRNTRRDYTCVPCRLEYSAKDDKFRLITAGREHTLTMNVARISSVTLLEPYTEAGYRPAVYREKSLVMELTDVRNALERVMLHFSDLEKETEKLDSRHYRITVWYKQDDETEILIRILSFGPMLKVLAPDTMVEQIRQRLGRQFELLQETEKE